jgi:hypothetical protein
MEKQKQIIQKYMNNFEHYLKKIKEGYDPSKSSSPNAPWNETSFTEQNEDMLEYLEKKLGYTPDEIENFMSGNGYNAWETDIENLWPDLYMRTLTKGYDEEHDTPIYNDVYKKIEMEVKDSTWDKYGADYKKFKYELKKALDRHVVDTCLEDLRNLYLNHIPKNESGSLVPVQAGEVIKLQKPAADTFTNSTINNDGVEIADCTVCGATGVVVGDHICKTVIEPMAQVDSEYNMVERFASIRAKYGVNESKMVTKINWFKSILESDNTKRGSDSNKDLSSTPEQIATETERLFKRYIDDEELKQDILAMFPDYMTIESEDAVNHVLDRIYEHENITDTKWLALKPGLFDKFKEYFESNTLN